MKANGFLSVVFLALVALFFVVLKLRARRQAANAPWPFFAKKPLTAPEQILYHRLTAALPECIVLAQVQLSQVLGVEQGYGVREWNNHINRMSLDFLVCLQDFSIVAAIELDDRTHERPDRIVADRKKEKALNDAEIELIRWRVGAIPDEREIRRLFVG
ncbi:MAG TPA: DUF2726 domain-containing protein [Rhodocyclaceae bacterium]|nr:DUF2726 domain-containing protein [Rhodocyclaceae bacterium]